MVVHGGECNSEEEGGRPSVSISTHERRRLGQLNEAMLGCTSVTMVLLNRKRERHSLANISVPDADDPHYNVTCYTYPLQNVAQGPRRVGIFLFNAESPKVS